MVNRELRTQLRKDLKNLYSGRLESGDFEESYYFRYSATDDRAIKEIANWRVKSLKLRSTGNWSSLDVGDEKATVAKSMLFLNSEYEYEWPTDSISPCYRVIVGFSLFLILPIIMALIAYGLPLQFAISGAFTTPLTLLGILGMFASLCLVCSQPNRAYGMSSFIAKESDFWPFRRITDLHGMTRRCCVSDELPNHPRQKKAM